MNLKRILPIATIPGLILGAYGLIKHNNDANADQEARKLSDRQISQTISDMDQYNPLTRDEVNLVLENPQRIAEGLSDPGTLKVNFETQPNGTETSLVAFSDGDMQFVDGDATFEGSAAQEEYMKALEDETVASIQTLEGLTACGDSDTITPVQVFGDHVANTHIAAFGIMHNQDFNITDSLKNGQWNVAKPGTDGLAPAIASRAAFLNSDEYEERNVKIVLADGNDGNGDAGYLNPILDGTVQLVRMNVSASEVGEALDNIENWDCETTGQVG